MKGFLGSANVDTNSRLCMASSVAGHRRAFGADMVPGCYEDLDEADLLVLVGSNTAWCHPVLFQRMTQEPARARRQDRGDRSAPHRDRRRGRSVSADRAGHRHRAVLAACWSISPTIGALDRAYIDAHTTGFAAALARAREIAPDAAATAAATGLDEGDVARFFELFRANAKRRHLLLAGRQPVGAGHRQGQRHHQLPSRHRPHRPARHGAVLADRPAQRDGRARGRRPRQSACRAYGICAGRDRPRAPLLERAAHGEREGLKAVQMFEAIERGEIKALWVMATNPAVSLPRAGAMRDALKKLELFVVSENVLSNDTVTAGAHVLLPAAAWGEKDGTVTNSERRISRQRAFLPLPGEAQPDWWIVSRGGAASGLTATRSPIAAPPTFSASTRRCRPSRTTAPASSISAGSRRFRTRTTTRSSRCNGRCAKERGELGAAVRRRRLQHAGSQGPLRRAGAARAARGRPAPNIRCGSTPAALRDQWHTMTRTGQSPKLGAHKPEPFRRNPSARRQGARAFATTASPASARGTAPARSRSSPRPPAARLDLRADPLERCQCVVGARRRSGVAADRSVLRPARSQGDAGRRRAGRLRLSRVCAGARAARAAGRHLVGAGRARRRRRHPVCDQRRADGVARPRAQSVSAGGADRICRPPAAASIAPRPSSMAGSKARCSSDRRMRRRNGAISRQMVGGPGIARIRRR